MLSVIEGVDLIDELNKYDVILIGTNTYYSMGGGFQEKIKVNYQDVQKLNMTTKYGDKKKMGTRITSIKTKPLFSLCYITHGYNFRPDLQKDYLDYSALEKCIKTANAEFSGLKVATTMIGTSKFDGNGDETKVFEILKNNSDRIDLTVYKYEQKSLSYESYIEFVEIKTDKNLTKYQKKEKFEQKKERVKNRKPFFGVNCHFRNKAIQNEIDDILKDLNK